MSAIAASLAPAASVSSALPGAKAQPSITSVAVVGSGDESDINMGGGAGAAARICSRRRAISPCASASRRSASSVAWGRPASSAAGSAQLGPQAVALAAQGADRRHQAVDLLLRGAQFRAPPPAPRHRPAARRDVAGDRPGPPSAPRRFAAPGRSGREPGRRPAGSGRSPAPTTASARPRGDTTPSPISPSSGRWPRSRR